MLKKVFVVAIFVAAISAAGLLYFSTSKARRPKARMPTITTLPAFPRIPTSGIGLSKAQKAEARRAGVNREVYWTYKEGTSDIPHYWYREFDLDLGQSQGNVQFGQTIWSRSFENALVLVNADKKTGTYALDPSVRYCDVQGNPVRSPVVLKSRTAMLLVKNAWILPKQAPRSQPSGK